MSGARANASALVERERDASHADASAVLAFPGGSAVVKTPTPKQLVSSAIGWLALAQDARQRERMYRMRGWDVAAEDERRAASNALAHTERVLSELKRLP